jgi:hypothetical protein
MEKLSLYIKDRYQQFWPVADAYNLVFTTGENGYKDATWKLDREFSFSHPDLPLNGQVYIFSSRGDTAWYGRLESVEPARQGGHTFLNCTATGLWASMYDTYYIGGTLGTSTTPEAMLATLLTGWMTDTSGLLVTGLTGRGYQTPNGGTDYVRNGDVILDICRMGTSTTGDRVIPQVWVGRKLYTKRLAATPSAAYQIPSRALDSLAIKRALSAIWNRIRVRYKSSADATLQAVAADDTAGQTALGMDYGSGITSLLRVAVRDITGLSPTDSTAATLNANAVLNTTKWFRNEPQTLTAAQDWLIVDTSVLQEVPNWGVVAGNYAQIPDLFDRMPDPADLAIVQSPTDSSQQALFYISETSYDADAGKLTITAQIGSATTNADGLI